MYEYPCLSFWKEPSMIRMFLAAYAVAAVALLSACSSGTQAARNQADAHIRAAARAYFAASCCI